MNAIDPGKEWDRVLNQYCRGVPPWGISTGTFMKMGATLPQRHMNSRAIALKSREKI
ncbi:MAG: hypothetical protein JRI43_08995 [Deltaproteobacteria bacterium]|nr:hypothetical protein [Deltaproteobacteria bacterium]